MTHIDRGARKETEYLLCVVHKHEKAAWASYIADRMELTEALMASGLTKDEIRALARMTYEHYKPEGENS